MQIITKNHSNTAYSLENPKTCIFNHIQRLLLEFTDRTRFTVIDKTLNKLAKKMKNHHSLNYRTNKEITQTPYIFMALLLHRAYLSQKINALANISQPKRGEIHYISEYRPLSDHMHFKDDTKIKNEGAYIKLEVLIIKRQLLYKSAFLTKLIKLKQREHMFILGDDNARTRSKLKLIDVLKSEQSGQPIRHSNPSSGTEQSNSKLNNGKLNLNDGKKITCKRKNGVNNMDLQGNIHDRSFTSSDHDKSSDRTFNWENFDKKSKTNLIPRNFRKTTSMTLIKNSSSNLSIIYEEDSESDKDKDHLQKHKGRVRLHRKYFESKSANEMKVTNKSKNCIVNKKRHAVISKRKRKPVESQYESNMLDFIFDISVYLDVKKYYSVEDDLVNDFILHKQIKCEDNNECTFGIILIEVASPYNCYARNRSFVDLGDSMSDRSSFFYKEVKKRRSVI